MPIGDEDWLNMHSYWRSNIVSGLKSQCHQSRRFDPLAWVGCQSGVDKGKLDYFISELFRLTNHVYVNNTYYKSFVGNMTILSAGYWAIINDRGYEPQLWLFILGSGVSLLLDL
mmetsp:Transcript_7831/g.7404  ORF Transcript_7831/g.7404 Transcript_7831/m.7404 type:complete len:114 (+) Transcript_7831:874-1215(+)